MKVVLASRNKNKIKEIKAIYRDIVGEELDILSLDDIGYTDEIEEDGSSFEENANTKASVPAKLGYIGLADDSHAAWLALRLHHRIRGGQCRGLWCEWQGEMGVLYKRYPLLITIYRLHGRSSHD
jgi:hypothetical protein